MDNAPPPPTDGVPTPEAQAQQNDTEDAEQQANAQLRAKAQKIVGKCQEFLEIYEGIQLNQPLLNRLVSTSDALLKDIDDCDDKLDNIVELADVKLELNRWKRIIQTFVVSMMGKYDVPLAAPAPSHAPPPTPQPAPEYRGKRDASPNTMNMMRQDLLFFMNKLRDDLLPDVGIGAEISNSELRDLYDVTLPQISKVVDECRRTLSNYMSKGNYDRTWLLKHARDAKTRATGPATSSSGTAGTSSIWTRTPSTERSHSPSSSLAEAFQSTSS
jgi:hypothetical protein